MRAAVMRGAELVVDDIDEPSPGAGQVLVQTLACGICGSDLHTLQHGDQMVEMSNEAGGLRRRRAAADGDHGSRP